MKTNKVQEVHLKDLRLCIPLLAFIFLGALFENSAPTWFMWFIVVGFAVSCAWTIWRIRSRKLYSLFPAALLTGILAFFLGILANRMFFPPKNEKEVAFRNLFAYKPDSAELVAYDHRRDFAAGGICVVVFKLEKQAFRELMEKSGYKPVDIASEPGSWRVSLCNQSLRRVSSGGVRIDSSFECFSKTSSTNRARVFFDDAHRIAVFLGYGTYVLSSAREQ